MSSPDLARTLDALISGSVATHEAVAERLGINSTDLRCLGIATTEPGLTPSRLAELAGLTTGAITGVLDRLERAGFVRREADPADRRRLRVQVNVGRVADLHGYYEPLLARLDGLSDGLEPATREALGTYLESLAAALREEAGRLRVAARGGMLGNTYTAPIGETGQARLHFTSGAPRLAFGGSVLGQQVRAVAESAATRLHFEGGVNRDELLRAVFDGPAPEARVTNGFVTMRYSRRLLDTRGRRAQVALNPGPAWSIEVEGGITDLGGDLGAIRLAGLAVRGGANHVDLRLGQPDGTARIVLSGGTSEARFDRPRGVATAIQIRGGVSRLRFDGHRTDGVGGNLRLQTEDYPTATDRFEIEVGGGASTVTVGEA